MHRTIHAHDLKTHDIERVYRDHDDNNRQTRKTFRDAHRFLADNRGFLRFTTRDTRGINAHEPDIMDIRFSGDEVEVWLPDRYDEHLDDLMDCVLPGVTVTEIIDNVNNLIDTTLTDATSHISTTGMDSLYASYLTPRPDVIIHTRTVTRYGEPTDHELGTRPVTGITTIAAVTVHLSFTTVSWRDMINSSYTSSDTRDERHRHLRESLPYPYRERFDRLEAGNSRWAKRHFQCRPNPRSIYKSAQRNYLNQLTDAFNTGGLDEVVRIDDTGEFEYADSARKTFDDW